MKFEFDEQLERTRQSSGYKNYLEVRKRVFAMLDAAPAFPAESAPSAYWREELSGFMYMLDASPLIIQRLRHHTYHLTGLYEYDYREHHAKRGALLAQKLERLRAKDRTGLLVSESPMLGGFGYAIGDKRYNVDTLKFYECLIGIQEARFLDACSEKDHPIIMEIGAGWGGFAYQWKMLFPRSTYCIVDLPEVIIYSGTYLKTLFPDARILFVDEVLVASNIDSSAYDFIFIPHYLFQKLAFQAPDLLVNMVSFQEMTTEKVHAYVRKSADWGIRNIYSLNRDRSPYNQELSCVSEILAERYDTRPVSILPVQYTEFPSSSERSGIWSRAKSVYAVWRWGGRKSEYRYRHIAAMLQK